MREEISLSNLSVIGYASHLEEGTLPRVLAPIFRVHTPANDGRVLFPPFTLQGNRISDFHAGPPLEFSEFLTKKKVSKLATIQAQPYHDLWVDSNNVVSYSPRPERIRAFEALYEQALELAAERLIERDYEAAYQQAMTARSLKQDEAYPLILRGAVESILGKESEYQFTRHLAVDDKLITAGAFDYKVSEAVTTTLIDFFL